MPVVKDVLKENGKVLLLALGILTVSIVGLLFINKSNFTLNVMDNDTNNLPNYTATIKTSMGDIEIDLLEKETPNTVKHFVELVKSDYYSNDGKGVIFHRVVSDFVIQTGDPTGTGMGGTKNYIDDEITPRKYSAYSVGMARTNERNTNDTQFFITVGSIGAPALQALDGNYTLFGVVTAGQDIVDRIGAVEVDENDKPLTPVVMESVIIHEN